MAFRLATAGGFGMTGSSSVTHGAKCIRSTFFNLVDWLEEMEVQ